MPKSAVSGARLQVEQPGDIWKFGVAYTTRRRLKLKQRRRIKIVGRNNHHVAFASWKAAVKK